MATKEAEPKPPKMEATAKPPKEKKPPKEPKPPKAPKEPKPPKAPKAPKPPKAPKAPKVAREPGEKKPLNKKLLLLILIILVLVALIAAVFILGPKLLKNKKGDAAGSSSEISSSETVSDGASSSEGTSSASESAPESAAEGDRLAEEDGASSALTGGVDGVNAAESSQPEVKEPEKPFEFSQDTLSLPAYTYQATGEDNALARAAHRDVQNLLNEKDTRPGVGISALTVAGTYTLEDGTVRVLVYVWGNRYAVAENTLFDYGSVAGSCAIDYAGGVLKEIHLPQSGDNYDASVQEMCGTRTDIAGKMLRKSYDLELRGQMIRNVAAYIAQNNVQVEYFRAGSQTYYKNGDAYVSPNGAKSPNKANTPDALTEDPSSSEATSSPAGTTVDQQLRANYKYVQSLPF